MESVRDRAMLLVKKVNDSKKKIDKGEHPYEVCAWYEKLLSLKKQATPAKSFLEDEQDIAVTITLEYLHDQLEEDHALKQLAAVATNAVRTSSFVCFDGRDRRLWFPWRDEVRRSVVELPGSESEKFSELLKRLVPGSKPHELVLNFGCSAQAFTQAWTALETKYGDVNQMMRYHLKSLGLSPNESWLQTNGMFVVL